jgi:hypothetical protein
MFTPLLLGSALFLYVMEMWARTHPDASQLKGAPADTVIWVDRFEVKDSGAAIPSVERYIDFVAQSGSNGGLIHNYINRGLRIYNQALWGVGNLNIKQAETDRMQQALARYIDTLEAHPRWALDPHKVVPAMLMTLEILESQDRTHDAETRRKIQRAREAALSLLQGPSTLWQRARVQDFFIRAGIALVAVKNRAHLPNVNAPTRPVAEPEPEEAPKIPVRTGQQRPEPKLLFGKP